MSLPKSFREIRESRYNRTLLSKDIVWDGALKKVEIEVPVSTRPVLIAINNVQSRALTATFDQKIILITPVGATATIGDPDVETITVTCETPGLEGEKYKIIVVDAEEESAELSAVLEDDLITVTLGTNENGEPDNTKNTAGDVATEIAKIEGFTAEASGDGSGVIAAIEESVSFTGGLSPTWASLYDSEGNQLSLTIAGETAKVFGTFDYFLRFYGGKIILTAAEAPEAEGLTTVIVQEV